MLVATSAIVVSNTKYGEADLIVKLFTRESGLKTYMVRGIRKTKKGKIRSSHFQPLSILDIEANHKSKDALDYLKEVKIKHPLKQLHTEMIHSLVVLFLSECFAQIFTETEKDQELFDFLEAAILHMDASENIVNHHLKILLQITSFLGFYPDQTSNGQSFNLIDGTFDNDKLLPHHASLENTAILQALLGTNFDTLNDIKMNRSQRSDFIDLLLAYFKIHLHGFKRPKSLDILGKILD